MLRQILVLVALSLCPSVAFADAHDADRAQLLKDIQALDRPGVPGNLVVFGDAAFAVVTGGAQPEPVIAATRFGKGRAVVMAHSGYLDAAALAAPDDSRGELLRNALTWVSAANATPRIAIIGRAPSLIPALAKMGYTARDHVDPNGPFEADIVIWTNGAGDVATAGAVAEFVEKGGGLISAACPWGWAQLRAKQGLSVRNDLPENDVLRRMGIVYSDGTVDATRDGRYALDLSRPAAVHAGEALADLVAEEKGAAKRAYLVERALRALPKDDETFLPVVEAALASVDGTRVPRPDSGLGKKDALARLAVTVRSLSWRDLAAADVEAFPGAEAFPGGVSDDAERIQRRLSFDPSVVGWQGTGLYLAPGEVLHVKVRTWVHATGFVPKWRLRIGCHTDKLWRKDQWKRWPEITHTTALTSATFETATPWGGLIYLEALPGASQLVVEVSGAVAAPRFVLGDEASLEEWPERRLAPGPWAEIEGKNMVLSVPSATVRELDDPARVAAFWDAALASHCVLAATPLPARRERFVPDVQISLGYMHSGYPIMMHLDLVTPPKGGGLPPLLDIAARETGNSWGYFHELGHNRQRRWWTFRGTTEVTCNLFSLYTHETLCGVEPWTNPWLKSQKKKAAPYLARGAPFQEWRRSPGLALIVYAQIQREFGWDPFIEVFRDYEEQPADQRPQGDQDKIDQFVVRLSRAAAHDLRPLWKRWGAPLSPWVMKNAALDELPKWMPDFADLK
jgi:hypothetical protein